MLSLFANDPKPGMELNLFSLLVGLSGSGDALSLWLLYSCCESLVPVDDPVAFGVW